MAVYAVSPGHVRTRSRSIAFRLVKAAKGHRFVRTHVIGGDGNRTEASTCHHGRADVRSIDDPEGDLGARDSQSASIVGANSNSIVGHLTRRSEVRCFLGVSEGPSSQKLSRGRPHG